MKRVSYLQAFDVFLGIIQVLPGREVGGDILTFFD